MTAAETEQGTRGIRVLLIGNHPVSLAGLQSLLDRETDFQVIGQTELRPSSTVVQMARTANVAVVDHGEREAFEPLMQALRIDENRTPVVILSGSCDSALLASAFREGARGLVSKRLPPGGLIAAIRGVHAGELWLEPTQATELINEFLRCDEGQDDAKAGSSLSGRDYQIVALVAHGLSNREIAEDLRVSEATIRNQLTSIFKKFGVKGRLQLGVYAYQRGLAKTSLERPGDVDKSKLRLV